MEDSATLSFEQSSRTPWWQERVKVKLPVTPNAATCHLYLPSLYVNYSGFNIAGTTFVHGRAEVVTRTPPRIRNRKQLSTEVETF